MTRTPALQAIRRKEQKRANGQQQTRLVREVVDDAKAGGCVMCGYNKCLSALEFHHVRAKSFELSRAGSHSVDRVKDEIAKCIVVCANCHREIHAGNIGMVNRDDVNEENLEYNQGDLFL